MVGRTIRMSNRDVLVHATPLHSQSSFHTVRDRENEVGSRTFIQRDENRTGREDFTITFLPDLHLSQSGDPVEYRVRHEVLAWQMEAILFASRPATVSAQRKEDQRTLKSAAFWGTMRSAKR